MISCTPSARRGLAMGTVSAPTAQVSGRQPDDIVGLGQIVDDDTLRLYGNAREQRHLKTYLHLIFKTVSREIFSSPQANFFEILCHKPSISLRKIAFLMSETEIFSPAAL